ncbi:hypothetical protein TRFO_40807 [Tritrichomonas foetus]|uniref:Uncharacterized protein n=1 Tax=Tritrichomonas foetus TaxID=1144522 RepID=A0A1J4J414_9EUKA|nr:hypothetical protein TRFO_40807 [Tritrichomonas foetus]|eukprot:OHS92887.1 hypothetical protein TRFO_40807 [Tritrichomonas foetus]
MERRPIDAWLPPINKLNETIKNVVNSIHKKPVKFNENNDIINSPENLVTLNEAIMFRKEKLRHYKNVLTECQNLMRNNLSKSQTKIVNSIRLVDSQIAKYDRILDKFTNLQSYILLSTKLYSKANLYRKNIKNINAEIHNVKKEIRQHETTDEELNCEITNINLLKAKIKKLKNKRKLIYHKLDEISKNKIKNNRKFDKNAFRSMQKSINTSIVSLRSQISIIDTEMSDIQAQKTELRSLVKLAQTQYLDIKKCATDMVVRTTQKCTFRTNVVDEMKKLIQLRRDKQELYNVLKKEKSHLFGLENEVSTLNSDIAELKKKKQNLIHQEEKIENEFLNGMFTKHSHKNKKGNKNHQNHIEFVIEGNQKELIKEYQRNKYHQDDYNIPNSDDFTGFDEEQMKKELRQIKKKKEIQKKEKSNLALLKKVEKTNSAIVNLRQKIRETQETILFNTNLKNEKEKAKRDRENQSILFSFEKIQNQINLKKENIKKLKEIIEKDKEFLKQNNPLLNTESRKDQLLSHRSFTKSNSYFSDFLQRIKLEKKRWISNMHVSSINLLSESWNAHLNELEKEFNNLPFD